MSEHGCLGGSFLHPNRWWLNITYNDVCGWSYTMLQQPLKNHSCAGVPGIDPACIFYTIREPSGDVIHFDCHLPIVGNLILPSNHTPCYYEARFLLSRSRRENKIRSAPKHLFLAKCPWRSMFQKPEYLRLERYSLCRSSAGRVAPLWKENAQTFTIHVFYCQMIILNEIGLEHAALPVIPFHRILPWITDGRKKKPIGCVTMWLFIIVVIPCFHDIR